MTSEIGIANEFNKFFTNIAPELAEKVPTASRTFETFLNKTDTKMSADLVTINELKEAFFSLKTNKSLAYDEVRSNVIKNCFSSSVKWTFWHTLDSNPVGKISKPKSSGLF